MVTVTDDFLIKTRDVAHAGGHANVHTRARTCYVTGLPEALSIPALREQQVQAIDAAAAGRDVLAVMPTGSGKSAIFMGVGLVRGGITLVVSPLRSLIADQARRCASLGLPCRIWNSDVADADKDETVLQICTGWEGFVYTTPESLAGRELSLALSTRVNTVAIDEAHCCLRERGFRVHYGWLGRTLEKIGCSVRVACTATLPAGDRSALVQTLHLDEPKIITMPVSRGNLQIHITPRSPWHLNEILARHKDECGIIFAATVKTAQKTHAMLKAQGRNVGLYHGRDMTPKDKAASQAAFMSGGVPVMVCTDAFLLGIDKPDIRFIIHLDPPKSIEDWCQGFGRAGRDGQPAHVYGCFAGNPEGWSSREFLNKASFPPVMAMAHVWDFLRAAPFRAMSAKEIGARVLGPVGMYQGGAIMTSLHRFGLCDAAVDPADGRRRIYSARGDFEETDFSGYLEEMEQAQSRFDALRRLVQRPEDEIPGAIDQYFQG